MVAESGAHDEVHGPWECAGVTYVVVVMMTDDCRLYLCEVSAALLQNIGEVVVNPNLIPGTLSSMVLEMGSGRFQ